MREEDYLPLSPKEFHILLALSGEPQNGYQILQRVEENSRGTVRLSPATQYVNLHRLVEKGLVKEVTDQTSDRTDGRGQRFWAPTSFGARVLRAEARRMAADARLVVALNRTKG